MQKKYRGSMWRKWDLHVHTPASYMWNGSEHYPAILDPTNKNNLYQKIVEKINSSEIAAYAIMDYWTFDGYFELKKYGSKITKTVFPGIELRIEAPASFRLNIHAIFCEDITEQELKDFKSYLEIRIGDKTRPLSDDSIIESAKELPSGDAQTHGFDGDYKDTGKLFCLGAKTISVTKESFFKAVDKINEKEIKCLVFMPYDTSDGVKKIDWKKYPHSDLWFMRKAQIFESRKPENIDLFLGVKTSKNEKYISSFIETIGGKPKPVVSGSDAHRVDDYGIFPNNRITWIKADKTFQGLKQIINEPADRTFIGELPEKIKQVSENKTKFISHVEIRKRKDISFDEKWFDNLIYLNPELVAIIGNKGTGKSALADTIGLLGNSKQYEAFSFLNKRKFKERQNYKAEKFNATITWFNNESSSKFLSNEVEATSVETVKYIPQNYLERLCNSVDSSEKALFDSELTSVIFSHIGREDRIGFSKLNDLLSYKTAEVDTQIKLLREDLSIIISNIAITEKKMSELYKKKIVNELTAKQAELEAHKKNKPTEVLKPKVDPGDDETIKSMSEELERLKKDEETLKNKKDDLYVELEQLNKQSATIDKALSAVELAKKQMEVPFNNLRVLLKDLSIKFDDVFSFNVNIKPIDDYKELNTGKIEKTKEQLDEKTPSSLVSRLLEIRIKIKSIEEKMDEPNRLYQKYLKDLSDWSRRNNDIQGNSSSAGSIGHLTFLLGEISSAPGKLAEFENERDEKILEIYHKLYSLLKTYQQYYAPVQNFIENNSFSEDSFKISFDASIVDNGFRDKFFSYVLRNKSGSFFGKEEGEKVLNKIIDKYNFSLEGDICKFVRDILHHLKHDCRGNSKIEVLLDSQIREDSLEEFYNFLCSLEYLVPRYYLKLNNRGLEQLSPGERGTLLLLFYLMLDKDDRPLILDQPEENLDNQTIYKVLVPCIKQAKKHRQIILVTHNPNLAVVCDAEQVIVAHINKSDGNSVEYTIGSIEQMETNRYLLDILEGTRPAFDNRDSKYYS